MQEVVTKVASKVWTS